MRLSIALLLAGAAGAAAVEPVETTVVTADTPVRASASPDAERLAALGPGRSVTVVAAEAEWAIVEFADGQRGYLPMDSLDRSDSAVATALLDMQVEWEMNQMLGGDTPAADAAMAAPPVKPAPSPAPSPPAPEPEPLPQAQPPSPRLTSAELNKPRRRRGKGPFLLYPLTEDLIADAVKFGLKSKGKMTGLQLTDSGSTFARGVLGAHSCFNDTASTEIYSPYSWIQQQASWAAKKYMPFSPGQVDDEMRAGILRVYAHPDKPTMVTASGTYGTTGVEHVIVRSTAKRDFRVVQPLHLEADTEYAKNAFGASLDYASMYAEFDMEEVLAASADDKNGEFFVVIIGESGEEKKFKIKKKHFSRLP